MGVGEDACDLVDKNDFQKKPDKGISNKGDWEKKALLQTRSPKMLTPMCSSYFSAELGELGEKDRH